MKLNLKEILAPTAVLVVICIVVSAALAGTNLLTKDKIAEQQAMKSESSRRLVLSTAESFESQDNGTYYTGVANGKTVGYVFETSAKGYGGDVNVMTGISADGEITGVVILSHSETPGLGANAEKEDFRSQYNQSVPEDEIKTVKYKTPENGEIEAMTGATVTSTAVTNAVNSAVNRYKEITEGGNLNG